VKIELPETLTSVGFIGGANMGFALARAVFARFPELTIHVCDPKPQRTALFRRELDEGIGQKWCPNVDRACRWPNKFLWHL